MPKPVSAETAAELADKFSVLVAYEDTQAHDRARQLCERLLNRFWGDLDFDFSWWSFDFLRDGTMAAAAAAAAANAQLIIFSVRTGVRLPGPVHHWIATWKSLRKNRGGALAVLMETSDPRKSGPAVAFLRRIAEQGCMDFLQEGLTKGGPAAEQTAQPATKQRNRLAAALKQILDPHSPPPHWGINE